MGPCSKLKEGEDQVYPQPKTVTLPNSPPRRVVARIGRGSFNNAYSVPKSPVNVPGASIKKNPRAKTAPQNDVLRVTSKYSHDESEPLEGMKTENALMRIAAREGIHPIIYAQSLLAAPLGCHGSISATLMKRETPLFKYLQSNDVNTKTLNRLFLSLYAAICRTADLGLCLCDIRPDNVLCDPQAGVCHLIDLGLDYTVWMDDDLFELFKREEAQRDAGVVCKPKGDACDDKQPQCLGAACAKTRGTQLYIMLLLFRAHLVYDKNLRGYNSAKYFASKLAIILSKSCAPVQKLLDLLNVHESCEGEEPAGLVNILGCRVDYYFKKKLLQFLVEDVLSQKLVDIHSCDGKSLRNVVVNGTSYTRDDASCFRKRQAMIGKIGDKPYPCEKEEMRCVTPERRYVVNEDGAAKVQLGGKSAGKGRTLFSAMVGEPVQVSSVAVNYQPYTLPRARARARARAPHMRMIKLNRQPATLLTSPR